MSAIKASDVYYDHVRALPVAERLKLMALLARDLEIEHGECEGEPRRSILELHGVGTGSRDGEDAQEYINRLRDEWEERAFGRLNCQAGEE
jgi:hypothetical protein